MRAGILSLDRGQGEAARALGMTYRAVDAPRDPAPGPAADGAGHRVAAHHAQQGHDARQHHRHPGGHAPRPDRHRHELLRRRRRRRSSRCSSSSVRCSSSSTSRCRGCRGDWRWSRASGQRSATSSASAGWRNRRSKPIPLPSVSSRGAAARTLLEQVAHLGVVGERRAPARRPRGSRRCGRCARARARSAPTRPRDSGASARRLLAGRDLGADVAHQVGDEREVEQALLASARAARARSSASRAPARSKARSRRRPSRSQAEASRGRRLDLALRRRRPPATSAPMSS